MIVPSEIVLVVVALVVPVILLSLSPSVSHRAALATFVVSTVQIAAYFAVRLIRVSGWLERQWQRHVQDRQRNRLSVGALVTLVRVLHLIQVGFAIEWALALIYLRVTPGAHDLGGGLVAVFDAAGIHAGGFHSPITMIGRLVLAASSLLGIVLLAFVVSALIVAFDVTINRSLGGIGVTTPHPQSDPSSPRRGEQL